ncbi:MAG: hypothetical protein RLO81_15335 [Fulvivirga sp.]|uniref:hypothetical protein n=1 Tax=Fulvivirga sp. TaxID=1931237 RepID=UPI0032EF5E1A
MKNILSVVFLLCSLFSYSQDSLRYYYNQGIAALKNGDADLYLQSFERANELRPYHPTLIHHLAKAQALNNKWNELNKTLRIKLMMDANLEILEDSIFQEFNTMEFYDGLIQLQQSLLQSSKNSAVHMELDLSSFHPEAITYNPVSNVFYLGGVYERAIICVNAQGEIVGRVDYESMPEMYAVMGLEYDVKTGKLWACTAALPEMKGYSEELEGNSSVILLDAELQIKNTYHEKGSHLFGDLILDDNGSIFISDGRANTVYNYSIDEGLTTFKNLSNVGLSLQGLTFHSNGRYLYVADYIKGLYRIDIQSKEVSKIELAGNIISKGFDGIYFYENSLIAIQNGVSPKKVWRLFLNKDGSEVIRIEVIDQALDILDEPTQGVLVGNEFIYIANSPWSKYEDGVLQTEQLTKTVLLKYSLK